MALAVLSGLTPSSLAEAIRGEQVARLVAIPGVGRKTAERLVIELRDRLDFIPVIKSASPTSVRGKRPPVGGDLHEDTVAALLTLGYAPAQAQEAARLASEGDSGADTLEMRVKRALAVLARPAARTR